VAIVVELAEIVATEYVPPPGVNTGTAVAGMGRNNVIASQITKPTAIKATGIAHFRIPDRGWFCRALGTIGGGCSTTVAGHRRFAI
jgi:hypothetical protein